MYRTASRLIYTTFRNYYTVKPNLDKKQYDLAKQIYQKIKAMGPIPVSDYMKEVLIHPSQGYYINREPMGESGDFITSPELSQIFGEMIAIWFLNEWSKVGAPKPFQIVELGPGRGTLMQDILRVFKHFDSLKQANISLVEISPVLSDSQARRLCATTNLNPDQNAVIYREGMSIIENIPVKWYKTLQDVPNVFTLLIANEFFDALPINKFKKTDLGYREILIDIDKDKEGCFRYVLAKEETPTQKLFLRSDESRENFEISPQSLLMIKEIATRIESDGGFCLIADYGHNGEGTDTFRAFKDHKQHDPLIDPGSADLTADVDFAAIKRAGVEDGKVLAFGPVTQRDFLIKMGIEHRIKVLEENADEKQLKSLRFGYDMLMNLEKMGERFKFMALVPSVLEGILKKVPVVGFH
ncbi:protein arginine methyltransferase NDUFAF7 homolog, mitochondrial [Onthophagus taurus]|uniref:protein arginine methyltransferase NDUFAF7 homolog, mitochondrial n=1 Tax=Onthophagus taurus TaxID=166361 RepID=UPI000C20AB21|nr:protein arginine methyltransferase NDUFAF7 homolog, mitochondrial [Onthophagus taurus]XP_022904038.1 protein arginine methyltransferase NDUFAF7 homolog, mitochondrial [Onthophagus taurus]